MRIAAKRGRYGGAAQLVMLEWRNGLGEKGEPGGALGGRMVGDRGSVGFGGCTIYGLTGR